MRKLPFIITENDLNVRLIRLLIILDKLSYSSRKNPILTIDKIGAFDFLLRYPSILYKVVQQNGYKNTFDLTTYETNIIDTNYLNLSILFNYDELQKLLNILIYYKFADIHINKNIYYIITTKGSKFLIEVDSEYVVRLIELVNILLQMRSTTFAKLNTMISIAVKGDI